MNLSELIYEYTHQPNTDNAYLVLHGASEGIRSDFIHKTYDALADRGNSVLAFNWPFLEMKAKPSKNLIKEQAALQSAVEFLQAAGYSRINIVAKSLGGIVTSLWLQNYPSELRVDVSILGYVIGDVDGSALGGHLKLIIQGEHDRFGNAEAVTRELRSHSIDAQVVEIANSDHSYRNLAGQPIYQAEAIRKLLARS